MAFETGNPSFRLFKCGEIMDEGLIQAFRTRLAPRLEAIVATPMEAWAGWRHLLDRDLDEENCLFVPWLYVNRMRSERKIPKPLLRAYCKMEEAAELRKGNLEFLPPAAKAEIKEHIIEQYTPEMPPTLAGYGVVLDFSTGLIYAEATSEKAAENFAGAFRETTGHSVSVLSPQTLAVMRKGVNENDLQPTSFTDDPAAPRPESCNLGLEFLTWMWYCWEEVTDKFETTRGENMEFMMQGPVAFYNEGSKGAHNVVIRNGLPLQSREAGAALLCGKRVRKIKIALADGERAWTATLDSNFAFTGVKLPKDPKQPRQSFHERMGLLEVFTEAVFSLYDKFIGIRSDPQAWGKTEKRMQQWSRKRAETADGDVTPHGQA